MLVYSFFDHTVPLLKKISEKISRVFCSPNQMPVENANATATANKTKKKEGLPTRQRSILKTVLLSVKWMLEFIIRRYLYHRNPFFVSDGIIVVVKPIGIFEKAVLGRCKRI